MMVVNIQQSLHTVMCCEPVPDMLFVAMCNLQVVSLAAISIPVVVDIIHCLIACIFGVNTKVLPTCLGTCRLFQ